ncbi:MAG: recombination mediator RecR [Alphaproteobacteria bacterium]|nr:recombination mediator RecR [Alphaproteobacteria bacterium]
MIGKEIDRLIKIVAKLPSLGPRSSRRIVLQLLKKKESSMLPLIEALTAVAQNVKTCEICGNYDTISPCSICCSDKKDNALLCVVQDVSDLWAMEKVSLFKGKYHVLGGVLSALDGIAPEDLNIEGLLHRIRKQEIKEVVLALPATVDGQITTHYLLSKLKETEVKVTTLAQGIPMGAELDYMDEGTLQLAFNSRKLL